MDKIRYSEITTGVFRPLCDNNEARTIHYSQCTKNNNIKMVRRNSLRTLISL
jgi:hypothetical protein